MNALSSRKSGASHTLKEIADWQLKKTSDIKLPDLQRGYVWKPFQVENLWDSLLRRFPVGMFLMVPTEEGGSDSYAILDGQQRATAIAFGFFDPWMEKSVKNDLWRVRFEDIPILWLDLLNPENNDSKRFIFRLLTRSHPWGYERKDNQTILTTQDRHKFLEKLKVNLGPADVEKRYLSLSLTQFWPWDAKLPVPFAFLLKSVKMESWEKHLLSLCRQYFPHLTTKHSMSGKSYVKRIEEFLEGSDAESLQRTILGIGSEDIPVIQIERKILEQSITDLATPKKSDVEDDTPDEIETLFVRINSAGTPLAGEELIYSIYKSIFRDTIDLVESAGRNFIMPSRLLSLATRIVQADLQREKLTKNRRSKSGGISLPAKVKVKDFRRLIHEKKSKFKERLQKLIMSLCDNDNNIFRKAQDILVGDKEFQLPSALAIDLARRSPEVIFLLTYRLHLGDKIVPGSKIHRKVLGFLTALSWFGRGENLKDHDTCLRQLWQDLLTPDKTFWRRSVLKKAIKPYKDRLVMLPLLPPDELSRFLEEWIIKKGKTWDHLGDPAPKSNIARWYKKYYPLPQKKDHNMAFDAWWVFLDELRTQKGFVLYAQREFVSKWFSHFNHMGIQNLEDTNCPWDWDHIHPQIIIRRKQDVNPSLKEWHNKIGNLRIWPMELNRSDSDSDPNVKLSDPDHDENPFFKKYNLNLSSDILQASFINGEDSWCDIDVHCDIKKKAGAQKIRLAIVRRMVRLYRHWFDELRMAEYFPPGLR